MMIIFYLIAGVFMGLGFSKLILYKLHKALEKEREALRVDAELHEQRLSISSILKEKIDFPTHVYDKNGKLKEIEYIRAGVKISGTAVTIYYMLKLFDDYSWCEPLTSKNVSFKEFLHEHDLYLTKEDVVNVPKQIAYNKAMDLLLEHNK